MVKTKKEQFYVYHWGNDKTKIGRHRLQFKGRKCRVLARGKLNNCCIMFLDNGESIICSRNALRKAVNDARDKV